MKTIKIIDLLNKIANGEEVPRAIKLEEHEYWYNETEQDYYEGMGYEYEYLFKNLRTCWLNDKVEILEEPKKIPEKLYYCAMDTDNKEIRFLIKNINGLVDKINEILDYLESKGE